MNENLKNSLTAEARALGFDCVGVTDPGAIADAAKHFHGFLDTGGHGDMDWLAANPERRDGPLVADCSGSFTQLAALLD